VPLRYRHDYAAVLHRGLPVSRLHTTRKFPEPATLPQQARCAPPPAHIHQVRAGASLRGVLTPVPRVRLSIPLAGPAPSGSTETSRLCQGRLPPSPAPPGSGCPQLHPPAATGKAAKVSHLHSNHQRLTAQADHDAHIGGAAVLGSRSAPGARTSRPPTFGTARADPQGRGCRVPRRR
jgi:hypothetical protein